MLVIVQAPAAPVGFVVVRTLPESSTPMHRAVLVHVSPWITAPVSTAGTAVQDAARPVGVLVQWRSPKSLPTRQRVIVGHETEASASGASMTAAFQVPTPVGFVHEPDRC